MNSLNLMTPTLSPHKNVPINTQAWMEQKIKGPTPHCWAVGCSRVRKLRNTACGCVSTGNPTWLQCIVPIQ